MKKESISTYIIALLVLSSLWGMPTRLQAQEIKVLSEEKQEEQPLFQGVYVGLDVFGFLNQALGSDAKTAEVSV